MIRNIWTLFETEEEKKERNWSKKTNINNILTKDRIIKYIRKLFEDIYYKLRRVVSGTMIILNLKIMVIKIETHF